MKKILFILSFLLIFSVSCIVPFGAMPVMGQEVIEVSSTQEFLLALGSNRIIVLKPGKYNLTEFDPHWDVNLSESKKTINRELAAKGISWEVATDGGQLMLMNIENLTIIGKESPESSNFASVIVDPRYAFVLSFYNCSNVNIENLYLGHSEGGFCAGGVLNFNDCRNIKLNDVKMFGCGTEGLNLNLVAGMVVTDSAIFNCTQNIMTIEKSTDISFINCDFYENKGGVGIHDSISVTFSACEFNNNDDFSLFADEQSAATLKGCTFKGNKSEGFWDFGNVKFENCDFEGE